MRLRLLWILLAVVVLAHVTAYVPCLQDDAFISFRYAQNLVEGHGLVFNPGERVEGYTNFLWTLSLVIPLALGLSVEWCATAMGALGVLGLVFLVAYLARERAPDAWLVALVPPLLLALDGPLVMEGVQGLETSFFALLAMAMVCSTWLEAEDPNRPPWSAVFGLLALLTRPEGVLIYGMTQGFRLLHERRVPRARQLGGWALVGGGLVAQLVFRLAYYGQPLPNTFYAKVGGGADAWLRGLEYLARFAGSHPVLVALTVIGAFLQVRKDPRGLRTWLLVGVLLGWMVYVVSVGGDFKVTWRFLQPMMGVAAVLSLEALLALAARVPPTAAVVGVVALWGILDGVPELQRSVAEARFRAGVTRDRMLVGQWLGNNARKDTVLAIHSSGTVPFYAGLPTIDMWGLSDLHIAHREMPGMGKGMPGHEKSDPDYVFSLSPDLYVPEEFFLTDSARPLPVPSDFPEEFESQYRSASVPLGKERWFNFFERISTEEAVQELAF